jgi:hypothetical protein
MWRRPGARLCGIEITETGRLMLDLEDAVVRVAA